MPLLTKLTPQVQGLILEALRRGCTYHVAGRVAGITRATLWNWLRRGRTSRTGKFRKFFDRVRTAEAEALAACAAQVMDAVRAGDAAAARWFLERRAPDEFGPVPVAELDRRIRALEGPRGEKTRPTRTARVHRERAR
jgi:hypothetical protein